MSILSPLDLTWQFSSPGCSEKTGGAAEREERRDVVERVEVVGWEGEGGHNGRY